MNSASSYAVGAIRNQDVDRAYTLLAAVTEAPSLANWRAFCREAMSNSIDNDTGVRQENIVIVTASREYVRGLCIYCIRDHWFYGRLLDVPIFVVGSAADAEGVTLELLRFLEDISLEQRCEAARFWVMGADAWHRHVSQGAVLANDHGILLPITGGRASVTDIHTTWVQAQPALIERLSR
jgi:hypothetical protein